MTTTEQTQQRSLAAIVTCTLATFIVNLDNTSLNVAMPSLRVDLGGTITEAQWVVDAYVVTLAAAVVVGGAMGDRFDKKVILVSGLALYCLGTFASAISTGMVALAVFRAVAGLGAAVLVPVGLATMKHISVTTRELTRNTALWGMVVGVGMTTGPIVGGLLTSTVGWRYIFIANLALGVCFIVMVLRFIPSIPSANGDRIDWLGQFFLSTTILGAIFAIIEVANASMRRYSLVAVAVGLTSIFIFVTIEKRTRHPLLDLTAFRSRASSGSMVVAILNYFGVGATIFFSTLYFQEFAGASAVRTGFLLVPLAVATALAGRVAGNAMQAWGSAAIVGLFGVLILAGSVMAFIATLLPPALVVGVLCSSLFVMGLGFGFGNTPVNVLAMTQLPASKSGVAGAAASASRQLGQSLGVAVIGASLAAALSLSHDREAPAAIGLPWLSVSVAGIGVIAVSYFLLRAKTSED